MAASRVNKKRLESIQYLRAFAALIVVFHHARTPHDGIYAPLRHFDVGQAGVDLFFVISGFIMYSAARSERPVAFARSRIVRVVPMYWIATLLLMAEHSVHHLHDFAGPLGRDVILSLFFVPHYSSTFTAEIWPYLVPGWTLNYEMFFYLIFGIGLMFRRPVEVALATLAPLIMLGLFLPSNDAVWSTYTSPLLIEFVGGMLIGRFTSEGVASRWAILLPIGILLTAASVFFAAPRVLIWGIPSMMIVLGALALESHNKLPKMPLIGKLGDASYSVYLFQFFAIEPILNGVAKLRLPGMSGFLIAVSLAVAGALILGLIAHYLLERPLVRRLSGARRPAPIGAERASERL